MNEKKMGGAGLDEHESLSIAGGVGTGDYVQY